MTFKVIKNKILNFFHFIMGIFNLKIFSLKRNSYYSEVQLKMKFLSRSVWNKNFEKKMTIFVLLILFVMGKIVVTVRRRPVTVNFKLCGDSTLRWGKDGVIRVEVNTHKLYIFHVAILMGPGMRPF